ncbi:MAG: response regulator [Sandaracinaceae bacterium]|nr:response regulator [Sandaracinaceae bacterium]
MRRVLARGFRWRGHETEEAGTVEAAIDRLLRGGIDLVVVDYELPDGTGSEFAREAQALLRNAMPPMILASASVDRIPRAERSLFGAIHRKPIPLLAILDESERLVRERAPGTQASGTRRARPDGQPDGHAPNQDEIETLRPEPRPQPKVGRFV